MSSVSGRNTEYPVRVPLSRTSTLVLGFGYFRNRTEDPWFKNRDLLNAIPEGPAKRLIMPSKSHYSKWLREFIGLGLVEGRSNAGEGFGAPSNQSYAKVTEEAEELLLESTTYSVTNQGLTVPDLFHIPQVAETILQDSDLIERVIKQISGLGSLAVNS
jgi:hypothetical protein